MHSDSPAWTLYCYVSFIVALAMMTVGITMIPGEAWIHAYFAMSAFFCSSVFAAPVLASVVEVSARYSRRVS